VIPSMISLGIGRRDASVERPVSDPNPVPAVRAVYQGAVAS
jgi:hypothetical protein